MVAAGPVAAATLIRIFVTDNKLIRFAIVASGIWFAAREISGPLLGTITDQFNSLQQNLLNPSG